MAENNVTNKSSDGYNSTDTITASVSGDPGVNVIQGTATTTNFHKIMTFSKVGGGVVTFWSSNGTDPNGSLSGTAGDVCFNCNSSQIKYCTGATSWS